MTVNMHDGSQLVLRKVDQSYDPTDRGRAFNYLMEHQGRGEIITGLLYIDEEQGDMHARNQSVARPLARLDFSELCPGSDRLKKLQDAYR